MDELINRYVDDLRILPEIQKEYDIIKSKLECSQKVVCLFEKLNCEEKTEVFLKTYFDNSNEIRKRLHSLQKSIEKIKSDSIGFIGKLRSEAKENKNDAERIQKRLVLLVESANDTAKILQQSLTKNFANISIDNLKVELAQHKKHEQDLSDQISNAETELSVLGFFAFSRKRLLLESIEKNKLSLSQTSKESYNMQRLLELKCDIDKTSAQLKVKKDYSEKINKLLCDIKILKELAQDPLILRELTKDGEIVKLLATDPYALQEIIKDSETLKCLTKNHFVSIKQQIKNEARTILFGNYPQNQETVKEPIVWRILDEKDGKVLLISDLVLYDRNIGYDDFMNSAFTQNEQIYIEKTAHIIDKRTKTIYEYDGPYYDEEGWFEYNRCDRVDSDRWSSSTMETKLFSLNTKELLQYFPNEEDRTAFSTKILSEKSPFLNGKKSWVLHSTVLDTNLPTDRALRNSFVDLHGNIKDDKYEQDKLGVRPAMWVNINY